MHDEAIKAAARAYQDFETRGHRPIATWQDYAEPIAAALAAALPHIRAGIAEEVEAIPLHWAGGSGDDMKSGPTMRDEAARVVRGEP